MIYNNPYVPFEIILRNYGKQGKNDNFLAKHSRNRVKLTSKFLKSLQIYMNKVKNKVEYQSR